MAGLLLASVVVGLVCGFGYFGIKFYQSQQLANELGWKLKPDWYNAPAWQGERAIASCIAVGAAIAVFGIGYLALLKSDAEKKPTEPLKNENQHESSTDDGQPQESLDNGVRPPGSG